MIVLESVECELPLLGPAAGGNSVGCLCDGGDESAEHLSVKLLVLSVCTFLTKPRSFHPPHSTSPHHSSLRSGYQEEQDVYSTFESNLVPCLRNFMHPQINSFKDFLHSPHTNSKLTNNNYKNIKLQHHGKGTKEEGEQTFRS